jgi:transcriptional regulator with XRE-family HTH domain
VTPDARAFRLALAAVLRARLGIVQLNPMDVARSIGVGYQTVRRIFAGDRDPTVHELRLIASFLDAPYEELIAQADRYLEDQEIRQRQIKQRTEEELG